jgi:hypothetical protein
MRIGIGLPNPFRAPTVPPSWNGPVGTRTWVDGSWIRRSRKSARSTVWRTRSF